MESTDFTEVVGAGEEEFVIPVNHEYTAAAMPYFAESAKSRTGYMVGGGSLVCHSQ